MTEEASRPDAAPPHTEYAIVIDAELAVVPHENVSFEEVCSIAFPDVDDPEVRYQVAYSNAAGAHPEGFLRPGETVKAKPTGIEFHVSHAGKS